MTAICVKSHAIIETLELNIHAKKCILKKDPNVKTHVKERSKKKIKHLLSLPILPGTG